MAETKEDGWDWLYADDGPPPVLSPIGSQGSEEDSVFEYYLIVDPYVPGYRPVCHTTGIHFPGCPDRFCRMGVTVLAFSNTVLKITAKGCVREMDLAAGLHFFTYCDNALTYTGIQSLDPLPQEAEEDGADDGLYFSTEDGLWMGLCNIAARCSYRHWFPFPSELYEPTRPMCVAGLYHLEDNLHGVSLERDTVDLTNWLPAARYYSIWMGLVPREGPLMSSTRAHTIVDAN